MSEKESTKDSKEPKLSTPGELLTPEAQAFTSRMISEAVRDIFKQIAPILESIAVTPAKMAEAEALRRAPDPAAVARETRERQLTRAEAEENRNNLNRLQSACPHRYPSGQIALHLIRNYPDRQIRGCCPMCQLWIHPKEWRIGAPDIENPRGKAYVVEAHPLYSMVREVAMTKS